MSSASMSPYRVKWQCGVHGSKGEMVVSSTSAEAAGVKVQEEMSLSQGVAMGIIEIIEVKPA